jgi:P pilus assembly chaperone PapD
MVAPFDRVTIDVPDVKKIPTTKTTLTLKAGNDYGGEASTEHSVR